MIFRATLEDYTFKANIVLFSLEVVQRTGQKIRDQVW